jgi:hypothetical protein
MRALTLLAVVALFGYAAADTTVATTQDQAKSLRGMYPACSSIVNGRLGALANTDGTYLNLTGITVTKDKAPVNYTADYTPCFSRDSKAGSPVLNLKPFTSYNSTLAEAPMVFRLADAGVSAAFHMPENRGEVPHFVANFSNVVKPSKYDWATVVMQCGDDSMVGTYDVSGPNNNTITVTFTSKQACARFPYTNESMPSGAVAALLIVLFCMLLQFGVCGWYHKTQKFVTPFTASHDDYHQVE